MSAPALHRYRVSLADGFAVWITAESRLAAGLLAPALGIHVPEIVLRSGVALPGRLAIPAHRSRVVLQDSVAVGVHGPEGELSPGVALRGSLAILLGKPSFARRRGDAPQSDRARRDRPGSRASGRGVRS
jgi:hypothetical protein